MAERPAWPAVLAAGWRSRPGVVRVAAALLGLLLLVALRRHPGIGGGIVTGVGALPLVLLLLPAARRPRRTAKAAPSSPAAQDQPQGWRRPFAGWGQFAFMLVGGGLLSAGGLVMALTSRGADRGAGASIALFFLACALVAPLFRS